MRQIVESRLGIFSGGSSEVLSDALDLFYLLRSRGSLRKKPATSELLEWITTLMPTGEMAGNPLRDPAAVTRTLAVLVKTVEDQDNARRIVEEWIARRK